MRSDLELRKDVLDELEWDPRIDATKIGVTVNNGVITLSGHVKSYVEKLAAEEAAKRVHGVKAIVEEIDVKVNDSHKRTDEDIAQIALQTLEWDTFVPDEKIQLKVEDGWITLEGKVDQFYQKAAAKDAVVNLTGVRGVINRIEITPVIEPQNLKEKIKKAFERNAAVDAEHVDVSVKGHKVILEGTVQSWAEKNQAKQVAWSAPGIIEVVDNIVVKAHEFASSKDMKEITVK